MQCIMKEECSVQLNANVLMVILKILLVCLLMLLTFSLQLSHKKICNAVL